MSWLSSFERRGFVYSAASAVSGCGCPFDDAAQAGVGGVAVPPGDVAADHAVLFAVGGVVGATEGELAQRGELAFEAVHPRGVRGRAGDPGVAGRGPLPGALVFPGGKVRAEVVADDRDPYLRRAQAAHVAQNCRNSPRRLRFLMCP